MLSDGSDVDMSILEDVGSCRVRVGEEYVGSPLLPIVISGKGTLNPGRGGGPGGYIPGNSPNNASPALRPGGQKKQWGFKTGTLVVL